MTLCKSLPALSIDTSLVLVILLVITDDIVAIRIVFIKLIVCSLLFNFLVPWYDIIGVKHSLMLGLLI